MSWINKDWEEASKYLSAEIDMKMLEYIKDNGFKFNVVVSNEEGETFLMNDKGELKDIK